MAGVHAEYAANVPCNIQHVGDLLFASGGLMREYDTVDVSNVGRGLAALAFKGGRLVGFNLLGDVQAAGPLAQALARGVHSGESEARPVDDGWEGSHGQA